MKVCPKCGREFSDDKNFCPQCGVELVYRERDLSVVALKSEVEASAGNILAYKSQVKSSSGQMRVANQEVMAVRSKVAGGHIVEGDYVHKSIHINIFGGVVEYPKVEEFYVIYLDERGNERKIRATNEVEIYRREKSWDVVVWDGSREIELGIRDMGISRKKRRVRIWVENGVYHIYDYGMRNGVYINGQKIERKSRISPGDVVKISTLIFRIERNPNQISVKKNAMMFIDPKVAKALPKELVYYADGKYYLNALGLKAGEVINAEGRRIVVEDSTVRESVMISRELLSDMDNSLLYKMIEELHDELPKETRERLNKLIRLYEEADVGVKYLYKKEILKLLEGEK